MVLVCAVMAHDFSFAGASPNHSATAAFALGLTMWFIHMYMQFGFLASDESIQVSDQPVAPSLGRIASIGGDFLSACDEVRDHLPGGARRPSRPT